MAVPTLEAFIALQQIHRNFDQAAQGLEQQIGTSICVSKCGLCCRRNQIPVAEIEASYLISRMTGGGKVSRLISLAEGWLLERHWETPTYEGMKAGFIGGKIHSEWEAIMSTPCPFLTSDTLCLVYSARPVTCRAYGVTRDASFECPRPTGKGETQTQRAYIGGPAGDYLKKQWRDFKETARVHNPGWVVVGLLPTMLYRQARPERFRRLVADNKIASAKLVATTGHLGLIWQQQVDALRVGQCVDLVAAMN